MLFNHIVRITDSKTSTRVLFIANLISWHASAHNDRKTKDCTWKFNAFENSGTTKPRRCCIFAQQHQFKEGARYVRVTYLRCGFARSIVRYGVERNNKNNNIHITRGWFWLPSRLRLTLAKLYSIKIHSFDNEPVVPRQWR